MATVEYMNTSDNRLNELDPSPTIEGYGNRAAQSTSNGKSYASRISANPNLIIDTSTPPPEAPPTQPPVVSADPNNLAAASAVSTTRKGSLSDRSPLQKLGDFTKEEKRARIEQAENVARQRSQGKRNPGDWTSSGGSTRNIPIRSLNYAEDLPTRSDSQRMAIDDGLNRSRTVTASSDAPKIPYNSGSRRVRSSGYDASLTGGAAAAAVGAYQTARLRQFETRSVSADAPHLLGEAQDERGLEGTSTAVNQNTGQSLSGLLEYRAVPTVGAVAGGAQNWEQPNLNSEAAGTRNTTGQAYAAAPQTTSAQPIRKQVAFQTDEPADREDSERHGILSPFSRHHGRGRKYEASEYLNEWSQAHTAVLTSTELDLDSVSNVTSSQAWWERDSAQRQHQSQYKQTPTEGSNETIFTPSLTLKCGPLLRYTGIHMDPQTEQDFWRGSVMIVTEDSTSSYTTAPTLRLFKQSMESFASSNQGNNQDSNGLGQTVSHSDPIAGHAKMSRTGKTLFVKPVNEIEGEVDLSHLETDEGLFSSTPAANTSTKWTVTQDGEKLGRFQEVKASRLHAERGFTFWRFNLQVQLRPVQTRIAYRINGASAIGFWVPPIGQLMNVMFHSCNGFSLSVSPNDFSGPDPLWRDVLNNHAIRPFHCMVGGGDQIYNDAAMRQTRHFQDWLALQNPEEKHSADFSVEMQDELEQFYFNHYASWFSQGLFGLANSQIPMVNMWDDHDIIDGFGSYPHHFMSTPVFSGIGAVAFKYYMLFQQQSVPEENEKTEPSWLLGARRGPYIHELSRSIFLSLGKGAILLALDCRTERMRDEVLSQETYDLVFDRCRREIVAGQTKHLLVLLGVPIAYPRLNFLENVLTSRAMDPIKALGRAGIFSGFINKFDGGVEILDDLDDHWTAKHHKIERNWFIQELQELAAETSVRITILSGDVHLGAVGQFYSNPNLGIPKDHDHRYMPNVISSAIVNTPPPEMMADILNKRNKVHHLDKETDEHMIPLFQHDVNGKSRNNNNLLPRRNWCSIREYHPGSTPPPTPPPQEEYTEEEPRPRRSFSFSRSRSRSRADGEKRSLLRRFSSRKAPPSSYHAPNAMDDSNSYNSSNFDGRSNGALESGFSSQDAISNSIRTSEDMPAEERGRQNIPRSNSFQRRPTTLTRRASKNDRSGREGHIDLQGGLDVILNCEIDQGDPAGYTAPYRLIVPALFYQGPGDPNTSSFKRSGIGSLIGSLRRPKAVKGREVEDDIQADSYGADDSAPHATPAVPGNAFAKQIPEGSSNREVLVDSSLPTTQPPPTFQGDVPTPLEDSAQQSNLRRSGLDENALKLQTSPEASRDLPARAATTRETRERPQEPMRRYSASGPPPPDNINQLPASVRKRYEQLNDPALKESTKKTDPSRKRYSQMNDPAGHKRFSQYEPLAGEQPPTQRYSAPLPPPKPEETHRRYSSAPMEMPLLPTNINHLRSSTHRTLQETGPWHEPDRQQRSVSGPAAAASAATGAQQSAVNLAASPAQVQQEQIPASSSTANNGGYVSTAAPPSMLPLSRGQAKRHSDIPSYPSPLASHAPQEDAHLSQYYDAPEAQPTSVNTTQPLSRELDDSAYGYRDSGEVDRYRDSRGFAQAGMPEKVARHYGGYDGTTGVYTDEPKTDRRSRGISGLVRRVSESAAQRRRERRLEREQRYHDERYHDGHHQELHGDDQHLTDEYGEEYYDDGYEERRPTWKFWQR